MLEFDDQIHIAGLLAGFSRERAEQSDPLDSELGGELRLVLPHALEDGFLGEAAE